MSVIVNANKKEEKEVNGWRDSSSWTHRTLVDVNRASDSTLSTFRNGGETTHQIF